MSYWQQRDISPSNDEGGEIEALLDHLPAELVLAIFAALNGDELLTQYRIEDYDG